MHSKVYHWMISIIMVFVIFTNGFAQDRSDTKYGVGFQGSFPAYGISGMMDINETISAQAIIGFFSHLKTYAARGLYRFRQEDNWNLYGYGMIGIWNYGAFGVSETVVGFGAGAGIEYDWRAFDPDLPPLFWNIELGLGVANFDKVAYDFNTLLIGVGVHYRF